MNIVTLFFGGMPGLILALSTLIIALVRPGVLSCSIALILNVLVARLVHRNTLQEGQPAGPFRPMFAAAGYTAIAGAEYLKLFSLPFGSPFFPFNYLTIPFIFIGVLGVHWVNRQRHDAQLNGYVLKTTHWLREDLNVAEVERGFICLGVTGTMWTMILAAWAQVFKAPALGCSLGFEVSSLHIIVLMALYLLPWLSFSWWVGEKAVRRGIYTGVGISITATPLAYSCYFHSLQAHDWWRILLPPSAHITAVTVFVLLCFAIWWIRQSAATTGRGLLSGFFAAGIPTILLVSGAFLTLSWHPAIRSITSQPITPETRTIATYLLSTRLLMFSAVPLFIVLFFVTLGGLRAGVSSRDIEDDPSRENDSVAASSSQTLTVLLGSLLLAALVTPVLAQLTLTGQEGGVPRPVPGPLLSWLGYLPLMLTNVFIFSGLWVNGRFIAQAARLPHPRMAGAMLFILQAILIWGFDPSRQLIAIFVLSMAALLLLKKLFGPPLPEVLRSVLDYQRFVLWSCFLGIPIVYLTGIALFTISIEHNQLDCILRSFSSGPLGMTFPAGCDNLRPEIFWTAPMAMTAGMGLIGLLGMPLLTLPLYLYPIFKDRKAAEAARQEQEAATPS